MKSPPFLLGAAMVFWGWQTDLFWLGAAGAMLVELPHLLQIRWRLTQADLDRVWNLCVALFLGGTIYAFFSSENLSAVGDLLKDNSASSRLATINQSKRSLFQLLQWLPLMFLPIALAQAYGERDQFDLSTFSLWLRRKRNEPGYAQRYPNGLNVTYPYFGACLFAASAANQRTVWFAAGLAGLVAWALWLHRGRGFRTVGWAGSLLLALGLGFLVQLGLLEAQKVVQRLDEVLLARWVTGQNFTSKEVQTRIGAIGRMKLSGRILYRVNGVGNAPPPALLREASYNTFHTPVWSSTSRNFERVTPEANLSTWKVHTGPAVSPAAVIAGYLPGGTGLIPVPAGVFRLDELPALNVTTNYFGSIRVEDGPGFVQFAAAYNSAETIDSAWNETDLEVAPGEKEAVQQIARQLNLLQLSSLEAARAVENFFSENFSYSTYQGREHLRKGPRSALNRFLLEHRSGHCEYFATATTLLLRAANIPARYAVGFSVQEKSGGSFIVRERHAHAWCLAWIDGAWRDVDTTPASWLESESKEASLLEPIRDVFSRIWFEFSRWRWGHAEWKRYLPWLVIPLLLFAAGKVLLQRQWNRAGREKVGRWSPLSVPGLDSEFYRIEKRLAAFGFARQPGETGAEWIDRIRRAGSISMEGLETIMHSHYRLRFDPRGLDNHERSQLRQQAEHWLSRPPLSSR